MSCPEWSSMSGDSICAESRGCASTGICSGIQTSKSWNMKKSFGRTPMIRTGAASMRAVLPMMFLSPAK